MKQGEYPTPYNSPRNSHVITHYNCLHIPGEKCVDKDFAGENNSSLNALSTWAIQGHPFAANTEDFRLKAQAQVGVKGHV